MSIANAAQIATLQSMVQQAEETAKTSGAFKNMTNEPLARLLYPPHDLEDQDLYPPQPLCKEEVVLIRSSEGRENTRLVSGETGFLDNRYQWDAFPRAYSFLLTQGVPFGDMWDTIHHVFNYTYGAMAICRYIHQATGKAYVLAGIRNAPPTGFKASQVSFPAGRVKPGQSLHEAIYVQIEGDMGLDNIAYYPDFAPYDFLEIPSITFAAMMVNGDPHQDLNKLYESNGSFVWVDEDIFGRAALSGDSAELVAAFRSRHLEVPDTLEIAEDASITYQWLSRAYAHR